jgi:hypothetical protein
MPNYNEDIFRSHTPFSFVVIGGAVCPVKNYDLQKSNKGEADMLKLSVSLDVIDPELFVELKKDEYVPVSVYSGYLIDTEKAETQIKTISNYIKNKQFKNVKTFANRFGGFMGNWEISYGDERKIDLTCYDWSQVLRQNAWERNLKDGETEVKTCIALLQKNLPRFNIIADSYSGSLKLGEQDQESKKWTYSASGKKYWEILQDCAQKMGKKLFMKGLDIYIKTYLEAPLLWTFYYGSKDSPTYQANKEMIPFKTAVFRAGKFGEIQHSNVIVELTSRTTSKKGKASLTKVRFPENSTRGELTKFISKTIKNNLSDQELKVLAENIYKKESKDVITGNLDVDFANPYIDVYDTATFVGETKSSYISEFDGVWFSINSINETYGPEGYMQTMDFDSDPAIKNTLKEKSQIIPKAKSSKMGYDAIKPFIGGNSSEILNRKL